MTSFSTPQPTNNKFTNGNASSVFASGQTNSQTPTGSPATIGFNGLSNASSVFAAGQGQTNSQTPMGSPASIGFNGLSNAEVNLTQRRSLLDRSDTYMQDLANEIQTAPIFTETIRAAAAAGGTELFPQYGLLAGDAHLPTRSAEMLYYNVAAPSSTFVCGGPGSGKSHTLLCLLENCLFKSAANELPQPLTGIVFHYDAFLNYGDDAGTACEAALLAANSNVKVRVLCAPTNLAAMERIYKGMRIVVEPLRISQQDLNTKRIADLVSAKIDGATPRYMHAVNRILRDMRTKQQQQQRNPSSYLRYRALRDTLKDEHLTYDQGAPSLYQRLDSLESIMARGEQPGNDWTPRAGQLTVVDLSCPCVTAADACQWFNLCLSLFLEHNPAVGRVVALDDAHKYMNGSSSGEAAALTESLRATVRLPQRPLAPQPPLAPRPPLLLITAQEPALFSPGLLELCAVTIVHRFTAPAWLRILQKHLAGVCAGDNDDCNNNNNNNNNYNKDGDGDAADRARSGLFAQFLQLRVGEALLFAPGAVLRPAGDAQVVKLNGDVLKIRIRKRITSVGGGNVMAG